MKVKLTLAAALLVLAASPVTAQRIISQGMSPDQVRSVFGAPARTRDEGEWSYWFYSNGCPNRCGSDDVVFFRENRVVAAVLRTRGRRIDAPPAADAIGNAGGAEGAAAVRAQAPVERGPAPRQERVIVRGRSRERNGTLPPAEVGGVRVESGTAGTAGQARDVAPVPRSGSNVSRDNAAGAQNGAGQTTIIRSGANQGLNRGGTAGGGATQGAAGATQTGNGPTVTGPGPLTAGAQPPAALTDTTGTARATAVDDERATRESKVTRTTVTNQPDSIQARRRDRENSVTPRVVPRP